MPETTRRPELQRWSSHQDARELNFTLTSQGWIEFEGAVLVWTPYRTLQPGDTYLAAKNNGLRLLTVNRVNHRPHTVIPMEQNKYHYDLNDCYRVRL